MVIKDKNTVTIKQMNDYKFTDYAKKKYGTKKLVNLIDAINNGIINK